MKKIQKCEHCGAKRIVYKRAIRPQQIMSLYQLAKFSKSTKMERIPGVGIHSYPDFCRLRYWNLIAEDLNEKHHWYMTSFGKRFLIGNEEVPKYLWIYRNEVQPFPEGELAQYVTVGQIENKKISKEIIMTEAKNLAEFLRQDPLDRMLF